MFASPNIVHKQSTRWAVLQNAQEKSQAKIAWLMNFLFVPNRNAPTLGAFTFWHFFQGSAAGRLFTLFAGTPATAFAASRTLSLARQWQALQLGQVHASQPNRCLQVFGTFAGHF